MAVKNATSVGQAAAPFIQGAEIALMNGGKANAGEVCSDTVLGKLSNDRAHYISRTWPIGVFLLCVAIIVSGSFAAFSSIRASEKEDVNRVLASIGQLKANQIQSYLSERKNDASVVLSFLSRHSAQHWLTHQRGDVTPALTRLAESIVAAYRYKALLLLDSEANVRLNTSGNGTLTEEGKSIAQRAMRERTSASFTIYFGDPSTPNEPVLDTFVPIMSPDGAVAVGTIVMRNDLRFLSQLLKTWPIESETAESLLVTKDGGDVLFLNELRHNRGTAARLRIPLSTDPNALAWPAILAVTGHFGPVEAKDYRGRRVLAYTLPVSGTPWIMVAKIDLNEAAAHSQRLLRVALIIVAILIAFTGIIVWMWWRKNRADQLANRQLQESEGRYRLLVESSPFCIHEIDLKGRLQSMNRAGLDMLRLDDAGKICGTPYLDAVSKQDAERVEALMWDAINNGTPSHFEFAAAGEKTLHLKSCFIPIRDADGRILKLMGITEDITERKESEQRMQELIAHLEIVREEEKASIAREIHDDLGGTLTAVRMETRWLADEICGWKGAEHLHKHIELISQLTQNAADVARRVITGLRPTILDDLGLLAALEWQAGKFQKLTGIRCRVNGIEDNAGLDGRCSIALFRIFQEALTNVARHSGASRVEVELHSCDEEVVLSVSDNGRGLPEAHTVALTSYGIRGMRERIKQLGGQIRFDSAQGRGLTVTVTLALQPDMAMEGRT